MNSGIPPDAVVGVVGAGTMGSGIAWVAAEAGHEVLVHDSRPDAVESAVAEIGERLDRSVAKGTRTQQQRDDIVARIHRAPDLDTLVPTALIVEAIAEQLEVKQSLFASLESVVADDTILATNTSSLSVTAVAGRLRMPERVVGMHFFNPAPVMPLVEIVVGAASDPAVVDTAYATAAAWGKSPVRCASTPGFIVNRVARPFYSESLRLLAEGIGDAATIDALVTGAGGFRMGPFALMDLVGLDVNLAVTTSVYNQTLDPRFAPNVRQQALVDAGRLGRKTGSGWFSYPGGGEPAPPLPPTAAPHEVLVPSDPRLTKLADRLEAAGVGIVRDADVDFLTVDGVRLMRTDGRSASLANVDRPDPPVILYDLVHDWETASAIAVAAPPWASQDHLQAVGVFQAAGIVVYRVVDIPGLVVARIVAQLASVAADAATEGVATPDDIDTAMRLGTNYPAGPFEWVEALSASDVMSMLINLRWFYGEDRYRTAGALSRSVFDDLPLRRLLQPDPG